VSAGLPDMASDLLLTWLAACAGKGLELRINCLERALNQRQSLQCLVLTLCVGLSEQTIGKFYVTEIPFLLKCCLIKLLWLNYLQNFEEF